MDQLFDLAKIIEFRHYLHQNPELSDSESKTAESIISFLSEYQPDKIIKGLGGNGVACIFRGSEPGPSVLFRCDMDALPIIETNDFNYKSVNSGVSHKCGHDGHMAILVGLAEVYSKRKIVKGQVILLFQPSEENGQGAKRIVNDPVFKKLKIDFVFALHNLPDFLKGEIVLKNEIFASASKGFIVKLMGKTSHAGEPENGISPAIAMSELIKKLHELPKNIELFSDFTLVTIVHAQLGEVAFGTSPGNAVIMATLRSSTNSDMEKLTELAEALVEETSKVHRLKYEISYVEEFPAVVNNKSMVGIVENAANKNKMQYSYIEKPFRWSEDFAHFTLKYPGALFGLGSGIDHPQLHNPDYDFPDEIIENGVLMFFEIYNQLIEREE